jgi:hypothetical protein
MRNSGCEGLALGSLFSGSFLTKTRRGGRRAAYPTDQPAYSTRLAALLSAIVAEHEPDGMTCRELARFQMAKQMKSKLGHWNRNLSSK